jgi:hypothetical protein
MWRLQRCSKPRDGSRGHGARGGSRAPLSWEAGAGATEHAGMRVRLVFRLGLELVHRGTQSIAVCSGFAKKVLTVTSDPEGCWPRALGICDDPQAPLIITGIG